MAGLVTYRNADTLNNDPVSLANPLPVQLRNASGSEGPLGTSADPEFTSTSKGVTVISATFTRPADTTAYTAGDLAANSTTAGSVVPVTFASAVRAAGEGFRIERVRMVASSTVLTNASFRLYLFRASPTVSVGDNAAFNASSVLAVSDVADMVGWVDITLDRSGTASAVGRGTPATGSSITVIPTAGTSLFGLVEVTAAYTPTSAEVFTFYLEGQWS